MMRTTTSFKTLFCLILLALVTLLSTGVSGQSGEIPLNKVRFSHGEFYYPRGKYNSLNAVRYITRVDSSFIYRS